MSLTFNRVAIDMPATPYTSLIEGCWLGMGGGENWTIFFAGLTDYQCLFTLLLQLLEKALMVFSHCRSLESWSPSNNYGVTSKQWLTSCLLPCHLIFTWVKTDQQKLWSNPLIRLSKDHSVQTNLPVMIQFCTFPFFWIIYSIVEHQGILL